MKFIIFTLAFVLFNLSISQAQTVCDRNRSVVEALEDVTEKKCAVITQKDLEAITEELEIDELKALTATDLDGLVNLNSLVIYTKDLSQISPGSFQALKKLTRLQIDTTEIIWQRNQASLIGKPINSDSLILKQELFKGLSKLKDVFVRNNFLKVVNKNTFINNPNLTSIYIESLNLSSLEPGALNGLTQLENLRLSKTGIDHLDQDRLDFFQSFGPFEIKPGALTDKEISSSTRIHLGRFKFTSIKKYALSGLSADRLKNITYYETKFTANDPAADELIQLGDCIRCQFPTDKF